jgi:hypothetical protein
MNMLKFLKSVQRGLDRSALPALVAGAAAAAFPVCSVADEPLVTNVGRFEIPFDIETEPGQRPEGFAVLFGSQDGGRNWEKLNTVPASSGSFTFSAPRDGRYSFAIRTTDAQGNLQQAIQGSAPELEVVVDTVAPDIRLDLLDAGNGQVLINWITKDAAVVPQTLMIEFADGTDGRWKSVPRTAAASGQTSIQAPAGSMVSVRSAVQDAAGNQGETSAQLELRSATPAANVVPGNQFAQSTAVPLGPSPFPGMNPPGNPATLGSNSPAISSTSNPSSVIGGVHPAGGIPQIPSGPALMDPASSGFMQPQSAYTTSPTALPDVPASIPMKEASYQSAAGAQMVNHHIFDLEYQVDDVGPSGVSAVELFVTEDGGQHWFTYGIDDDVRSPILIDTRGEGTFGFAVRVRNGLGFADDAPQPGQSPEMVVTVDESPPVIELPQPTMRTDGFGTIQLSWQVRDQNPAGTPVRLEYAAASNGPWTPVFDWQFDQSGYQWGVRPGTPTQLYFRLLARDAAGNVATAQTTQPVVVDLRRPVGRLLRVQSVSQPGISK